MAIETPQSGGTAATDSISFVYDSDLLHDLLRLAKVGLNSDRPNPEVLPLGEIWHYGSGYISLQLEHGLFT